MIGKHEGVSFYTVGQHKGLGVGGVQGLDDAPFFVVGKDMKTNCLYVAQKLAIEFAIPYLAIYFHLIGLAHQIGLILKIAIANLDIGKKICLSIWK